MKKYETQQVITTHSQIVGTFCDWCGAAIPDLSLFDRREFTLSFATGENYPEGGHEEGWQVEDLCDSCIEKLRLLLLDAGVTITSVEGCW